MTAGAQAGAVETKSADISAALEELMYSFEAFKEANDQRLKELERRSADPLTAEKVERISEALDEQKRLIDAVVLKNSRPPLALDGGASAHPPSEHKQAFEAYVRTGDERRLRSLEEKAMSYGTPADGGYLVPDETENEIGRRLAQISPIRSIASVRKISSAVLKKPFATTGIGTGWVAETASRTQTTTNTLAELSFATAELYAMPAATAALLEDSMVDLDAWIAGEIETVFAEQEGKAFVEGDGSNKPKGFLSYTTVADASWSWGNLGYIATGNASGLASSSPTDTLIDLVYALKAGYRQNATWVMNRKTQAALRKLKDDNGQYIWQPPAAAGSRAMLMGFPVVEAEDMPDIGAGNYPIAFGDFRRGYLVVDRAGVRILRDPYSAKPYVLFYTTKRVGGGIQDFEAIKLLKVAAN
ncbi:phage major capsid protein [Chelativorans composti]|uniref:Phage major capsid protein n=1 Tax=Chelativorans composti TaxID=768533 RepID=A0ABW5DH82_9HYPH